MTQVAQWTRFETQFTSSTDYGNPVQDARLEVDFASPSGMKHTVWGFWDGDRTWRVRFSPDELGDWSFRSRCSREADSGLNGQGGRFRSVAYKGENPLYRHGAIQLSEDRRYLRHADGTPYFWLSDTAWNGAVLSDDQGWETYLQDRVAKGFTAVQFVATHWFVAATDADGNKAYTGAEKIAINPIFYQRLDRKLDALNQHGLVAGTVMLWVVDSGNPEVRSLNPGTSLPDDQLVVLAQYLVARYGAHHVIWILGGDGHYERDKAERWKRIGRAAFACHQPRPATMHACGQSWVADEFRGEPWYSFNGYQSGHGDSEGALRWLCQGPPSTNWRNEPHKPDINLEPNYEAHVGYNMKQPFDDHAVRRAAYWSLLVSPPAGVSYGGHGVWSWQREAAVPLHHGHSGVAAPWHQAIHLPGSGQMKHLRGFFASFEWWRLRPAQELLAEQPGKDDPRRFVAAAKADDGSLAVVYVPVGTPISLQTDALKRPAAARWFNPRTGAWSAAGSVAGTTHSFDPPDGSDWVLLLRADR